MGSGASFDASEPLNEENRSSYHQTNGHRYYCHNCRRTFVWAPNEENVPECSLCNSAFVEEIGNAMVSRNRLALTEEQTRRLTTAAALLQMLEFQLRHELENAQAYANRHGRSKGSPLTSLMKDMLSDAIVDVEMICTQPSCPVCSEDYCCGEPVTQLPCKHIFHKLCVMPWLESKRTCPICRFELNNVVPTVEELEQLTENELIRRITDRKQTDTENASRVVEENDIDIPDQESLQSMQKEELIEMLHSLHLREKEVIDEEMNAAANETSGTGIGMVSFGYGMPMIMMSTSTNQTPSAPISPNNRGSPSSFRSQNNDQLHTHHIQIQHNRRAMGGQGSERSQSPLGVHSRTYFVRSTPSDGNFDSQMRSYETESRYMVEEQFPRLDLEENNDNDNT